MGSEMCIRDRSGDGWELGRTLEWSTWSPAPPYNFANIPTVSHLDEFWELKEKWPNGQKPRPKEYFDIHMPKDTPAGFIIAIFAGLFGFAATWHMLIPAVIGILGVFVTAIARTWNADTDYYIKAAEVKKTEERHFEEIEK